LNAQLRQLGKPEVKFWNSELKNFVAPEAYDVVYCISVVEHVNEERDFWKWLANLVKPGGLLFMTCDCVPELGRSYVFDNLRKMNYTVNTIKDRIQMLETECNMKSFGEVELQYNGNHVHDYTFASVCMTKSLPKRT
jgi:cyclopropane fatty-acyl-phospholipid synthase-like methyltransferase